MPVLWKAWANADRLVVAAAMMLPEYPTGDGSGSRTQLLPVLKRMCNVRQSLAPLATGLKPVAESVLEPLLKDSLMQTQIEL